jgi:predicted nucleic acid-binding protein
VSTYLLDANVLIALTLNDHEHHQRAAAWAAGETLMALSPVVEGALTRFLIRLGQSPAAATALLDGLYGSGRVQFWADDLSYRDTDLTHVMGHRQVTDAYLASLAAKNAGMLATFDQALAEAIPAHVTLIS